MSPSLEVTVTFFDANHCFGAAMVLLEGYMGTVLYTGDIRFDRAVFQKYELLYPPELTNEDFVACSRQIDLLYLDNTFLKKKFDFPKREPVLAQTLAFIRELIERNEHTRIYVALDTYGKEEVVEYIAKELDVYIVVD
jgi:Cft2 family RNA processing exonuclease